MTMTHRTTDQRSWLVLHQCGHFHVAVFAVTVWRCEDCGSSHHQLQAGQAILDGRFWPELTAAGARLGRRDVENFR